MEYTYEFLRKCHGLRFKAMLFNKPIEGVIKIENNSSVRYCYGEERLGHPDYFNRPSNIYCTGESFPLQLTDFEIVPRDPEKYTDWQVGDVICGCNGKNEIIFRSGEVVVFKYTDDKASNIFTCRELFKRGYRLVLTDIEKQIIEEKKKAEWKPQDGDVCYLRKNGEWIFIKKDGRVLAECYIAFSIDRNRLYYNDIVAISNEELRLATDAEKQRLFDALAENGKRWNAEKKVVENIEPESDEPVDVQKMIADALEGYVPKGSIEGFPIEVIAKMLERQYEQSGKIDLSDFERNRLSVAPLGFDWTKTEEGAGFWNSVICWRDFSEFFERYPKDASTGDSHTFREGEPVLVRDYEGNAWELLAFVKTCEDTKYHYEATDGFSKSVWRSCIPYNEKTMHLLGTTDDYKEEQP